MTEKDLKDLLDTEAARINSPSFVGDDPVQFPRRFSDLRDIEITSLLTSGIAWGNRKMICRDADRLLTLMDRAPYRYVVDEGYEDLNPEINIHRTLFGRHLQYLLRGLRIIYERYGSLDAFSAKIKAGAEEAPAWHLAEAINALCREANEASPIGRMQMQTDAHLACRSLPQNISSTALKRVNMALRWLVRDDGIVDLGIWKSIPKSKLYIPLDVHVGNTARDLGLLTRKANDRKSVEMLTATLRTLNPEDPCLYDFALFGVGMRL